jgi:hypothetical protein
MPILSKGTFSGGMTMDVAKKAKELALEIAEVAKNEEKISVFTIANTAKVDNPKIFFPPSRYTPLAISGNVILSSTKDAKKIIKAIDGIVDIILVDTENKMGDLKNLETLIRNETNVSEVLTTKVNDLTVESELVIPLINKRAAIIGTGNIGSKLALKLVEHGVHVTISRRNKNSMEKIVEAIKVIQPQNTTGTIAGVTDNLKAAEDADILIGFTLGIEIINSKMVEAMNSQGIIIDGGIGTIFPEAVELAGRKGIKVLRIDIRAGFAGALTTILETKKIIESIMGRRKFVDTSIVAGGIIGQKGEVVVDNISNPTRVIGVANGKGGVIRNPTDPILKRNLEKIKVKIKRR